ncbi:MAG: cyclodeaminase [Chloroflexota bacterium]
MEIKILNETEIRQCISLDLEAVRVVEEAFIALSEGRASTPLMSIPVPQHNGEMHVKSAVIQDFDSFAVKIASGFFDNPKHGLPSGSGMMLLFDAHTGFPQAVLLDNGYLTHTRTGAAGAMVAKHFAPQKIATAGVIGAGRQGQFQLRALQLARTFERVLAYDKDADRLKQYVDEMKFALNVEVVAAPSAEAVVRESDYLVTATPSREPFVRAEWLHPGLHITAMGADNGRKQELFPEVLARADRRICDLKAQVFRLGEHHFAAEAGLLSAQDAVDEIGEVVAGRKPGRVSDQEITVCDLTGVGIQDTAIALLAYREAEARGLGLKIVS